MVKLIQLLSSAQTRGRACGSCFAGEDEAITVAVCVLANVGVGQTTLASHMGGTCHCQG